MLNFWLYLSSIIGAFGVGFVISQIDAVIPIVLGRLWKSKDAWWRQILGVAFYTIITVIFIWLTIHASFFPLQLDLTIYEWSILVSSLVISSIVGIMFGNLELKNASRVIETIINTMFPSGGNIISLGAKDVEAVPKSYNFWKKQAVHTKRPCFSLQMESIVHYYLGIS